MTADDQTPRPRDGIIEETPDRAAVAEGPAMRQAAETELESLTGRDGAAENGGTGRGASDAAARDRTIVWASLGGLALFGMLAATL